MKNFRTKMYRIAAMLGIYPADKYQKDGVVMKVPESVELIRNVKFGRGGGRSLRLDILRLKSRPKNPVPVIMWIHGGGWHAGVKEDGLPILTPFAERGYFCVSIEYRLSYEAVFPAQIEDCKCAIRFLKAKAEEYNIKADKIALWGSSAGGHLAALAGTSAGVKELEGNGGWQEFSSEVQAVCDWCGPTDFLESAKIPRISRPESPFSKLLGGPAPLNIEKAVAANPITHISNKTPPFLILHGDKDPVVPVEQSIALYDALKAHGITAELIVVKDGLHARVGGEMAEQKIIEFFKNTIGN